MIASAPVYENNHVDKPSRFVITRRDAGCIVDELSRPVPFCCVRR